MAGMCGPGAVHPNEVGVKMAKKRMTTDQLVQSIDRLLSDATPALTRVDRERRAAIKAYQRDPVGKEIEGRSTYVSSEVQEAISWALPQILKVISTNGGLVSLESDEPDSQAYCQDALEYARYALWLDNPGYLLMHGAVFDTLLQKTGVLKVFWETKTRTERQEYAGLSPLELVMAMAQGEGIEHSENPDGTHDITIKRESKKGRIRIEAIPPEELIVAGAANTADPDALDFIAQRSRRTISYLREQGYKILDDINDGDSENISSEDLSLERNVDVFTGRYDQNQVDPSMRKVWVTDSYLNVDWNNDGIAELRRVLKVGKTVLENDEVHCQPFVVAQTSPLPHQFHGDALADLVTHLQLLKTMLMRATLDSFAFNISPTKGIDQTKVVDHNDLLNRSPGGYIRFRGNPREALSVDQTPSIAAETFPLFEYIDNITESRTGVSRYTQGIDQAVFGKTATVGMAVMNASQEKLALMVRMILETCLAPLYKKIVRIASYYATGPLTIRSESGEFKQVDPKAFANIDATTIVLNDGALNRQADVAALGQIAMAQKELMTSGSPELMAMVAPETIYETASETVTALGQKDVAKYFFKPGSEQYAANLQRIQQQMAQRQPPPDPNMILAQTTLQVEQQKNQKDIAIKQGELALKQAELQTDAQMQSRKLEEDSKLKAIDLAIKAYSAGATPAIQQALQQLSGLLGIPLDLAAIMPPEPEPAQEKPEEPEEYEYVIHRDANGDMASVTKRKKQPETPAYE